MEDPKLPKQLTEESPLDEFSATGNIYVDPSYTSEEATPAISPITKEALVFGENTLTNFTNNNGNSPAVSPGGTNATFISNLDRGTSRGNGHDYFLNFVRTGSVLNDVYIINSKGGDFSASPRVAANYDADSDGTLSVYIEGSTFGGNLMGFGSQTNTKQTFTGNYEFTFKKSVAQWFCITYGTGYGLGEGNAGNNRFGNFVGNIDLVVDGSTITNNGAILRGGINPGGDDERAYLRAYINDSLFQGEFGVIMTGVDGTMYKSNVDVDLTIDGSTFTNVFLVFPNVATNTQAANGSITTTGDVTFKATNTRFSGLNMGAGLGGTGWNRTGWIKGDIKFDISGSSNSSRTFIHKGFVGEKNAPRVIEGTLTDSIFGDFTGYDTRENNYIYADTTIKIVTSTIGNFTLYNTINSNGGVAATAERVFGTQTLEVTGSSAGSVAGNGPGATQSGATFDLVFHASDTLSSVGAISNWDTITVDAGANVRATSIAFSEGSTLDIAVGSKLAVGTLTNAATINVIGELVESDTIVISGLTQTTLPTNSKVFVNDEEYSYGLFGGQYSITAAGDLVVHAGTTYLVNLAYTNGQPVPGIEGPTGYSTIEDAQNAVVDPTSTTIMVYGLDALHPGNTLKANTPVYTKNNTISFVSDDTAANRINFNGNDLTIGNTTAVDTANVTIAYTDNINQISFGDVTGTANVAVSASSVASMTLAGAKVADAEIIVTASQIGNLTLANDPGFVGNATISGSTLGNVYGGVSGLNVDLSNGNTIGNVYAEGNGAGINLAGTTKITSKFVAGYSTVKSVDTLDFEGGSDVPELILGGDADKNTIGTLNATITGGKISKVRVGGANDSVNTANVTFAGGDISNVEFGQITGDLNATLSGSHFNSFIVSNVGGDVNVTLAGGTAVAFRDGRPTTDYDDNATFSGPVYGASVSGALDGGSHGNVLNVEGNAKVESVKNFKQLNVTGGTLNVAGTDVKGWTQNNVVGEIEISKVSEFNSLTINGDILNRRGINAGTITAVNLSNYGQIGVLRTSEYDPGINLSGDLLNEGYIKTSVLNVGGDFTNKGKITAVGDITVNGKFTNSGEFYFRSTFDLDGKFHQEGGLALNNVDVLNTGFISAATLTGVKNLTTSKMYITGGAEISGNITITAGAEVAFTNKANPDWLDNGLELGGNITMADNSNLVVSGYLTSDDQVITINCGNLIGYNEIVRAEGGINDWTIKLTGASSKYSYVKTDTSVVIYSTDELFVNAAYEEDSAAYYNGNKLLYGKNAFATVAEAVAAAKSGAKIHVLGDYKGADVAAAGYEVILDGAQVGSVTAKTVNVISDSTLKSIVAADGLTINAAAVLTVQETLPAGLSITIDGSQGTGSRLVLDVDPTLQTIDLSKVTVISKSGKSYSALVLGGDSAHAGDLYIISTDNVFFRKDQTGDAPVAFVDGATFDAATGDAMFLGVNVFGDQAAAQAAAAGGKLYLVGFNSSDALDIAEGIQVVYEYAKGSGTAIEALGATTFEGTYTAIFDGSSLAGGDTVYGLNNYVTSEGNLVFIARNVQQSLETNSDWAGTYVTNRMFIAGNDYTNVMNGNITATIEGGTIPCLYIGAGSFGTDETKPINIDVTIQGATIGGFYGFRTQRDNTDPTQRQDINANITVKVYDTVVGGTFTILDSNNDHWEGRGATLLQTYFSAGSINVEVGNARLERNIRVGGSLEGGGKAIQAFNVPATLHIVATENGSVTVASYVDEWDTVIVDATAQLQLNQIQYTTIGISEKQPLDSGGTLTQVLINMSGYKSGTHTVITASGRINTDENLSNISVIGDNDLTGQCELAYDAEIYDDGTINPESLKRIIVFDKTDDMFVNPEYTSAINGTFDDITGQEFLFKYNAHMDFEKAFSYANEWNGTITVTGGEWDEIDFQGNNVAIRKGASFEKVIMAEDEAAWEEATLTVENGTQIGVIEGSKNKVASTLLVTTDTAFATVQNFSNVVLGEDVTASFKSLSGSNLTIDASAMLLADSLNLSGSTVTIDVEGFVGRPHVIVSSASSIVGFNASNVKIVGENADKFGLLLQGNKLVLTTTIPSDTFLNSTYSVDTTGTILDDGTYLEYGFNAFSDSASAIAGLGSRSNTLTITGGEIAGDIVMNGANFALVGGALDGVVYATYEKDYRNMSISVGNGSVGGIEMTAQEGSYRVTRASIALNEGAVVNGSVVGAGDTTVTVNGNVTIAQNLENVKNLVIDVNGCLSASYIEMAEGGTIQLVGSLKLEGTNLNKVIDTTTGYSVDPTTNAAIYIYKQGNDVYALDLTRIYFDPSYSEETTGSIHANGDTLIFGVNAFSDRTAAVNATITGGTLYVNGRTSNFDTGNKALSLVFTNSSMGTLTDWRAQDATLNADINITIIDSSFGSGGDCAIAIGDTHGTPYQHRNTINGNVIVNVENSTIGGGTRRTINVADYLIMGQDGNAFEFNLKDVVVNNVDFEVFGDSRMGITDNNTATGYYQPVRFTMENVTCGYDNLIWYLVEGDYFGASEYTISMKNVDIGAGNIQVTTFGNWSWGTPQGSANVTFYVDGATVRGAISPDRATRDNGNGHNNTQTETETFTGNKVLNVSGINEIYEVRSFKEINMTADAQLIGRTLKLASYDDNMINIDATGYKGPTKSFIYMSEELDYDDVEVEGLSSKYDLFLTDNAVIVYDGTLNNIYWNPNYTDATTGATSVFGDVLIVQGTIDEDEDIGNAFKDFEDAKEALTEGNKLYVMATPADFDGVLYGTIDSEDFTDFINLVIVDGNFTAEGSIIAAADLDEGKVFLGDSTIEIAGGTYGKAAVVDADGNTTSDAIFTEINGTREVAGGTSGLLVTYNAGQLYANLTDFDYLTVKGNVEVMGDISYLDSLLIDCNGYLVVNGDLDADSIRSIVLTSSDYNGPSKRVLHSESLTQEAIDAMEITVDNPEDRWFYDGKSDLWLVSGDPSNVYVNSTYGPDITGTTIGTDLLYYGVNAVTSMEEAIAKATPEYKFTVTGGVFAGDYDLVPIAGTSVYVDGGTIGSFTLGNAEGSLARIELTGADEKVDIGTITGAEDGFRLIIDGKNSKVATVNNAQYVRVALDQNNFLDEVNMIEGGGRFVLNLSEFNGRAGKVFTVANGINNFMIPVEGETYSLARVEVSNAANNDYGFYYDADQKSIISVAMGANSYIRPDANTSLNGTVVDGTTLVYGFNVSSDGTAAQYAKGGTVFVNDILAGPVQVRSDEAVEAVITNSIVSDIRLGPTSGTFRRTGDFTMDVYGGTFTDGNAYFVGRGSGTDARATIIVGEQEAAGAEIVDGVYNLNFRAIKDEAGEIVARSRNNNTGNNDFSVTQNANIAGGTVNILFEDYYFRGDMRLFDNVWNVTTDSGTEELDEVNVRITNGNAPESKWMWIWDPREENHTTINLYITDTVFTGNDHTLGLFGTDTTDWKGEANVYINGFTMTEGRLSGARGVNSGNNDVGVLGERNLFIQGGTNRIALVKEFTTIDIADGAMLTGNTISLPGGTYGDVGFILRGETGYSGEVKEYAVVGTTIYGGENVDLTYHAEFLDADGDVIDDYVAIVGATNVFIYTMDGAIYYDSEYTLSTTGVVLEADALTGKKNFLVYGDNAVSSMADAYEAADYRDDVLIMVEGAADETLYANGYKLVVNGGDIGTLFGFGYSGSEEEEDFEYEDVDSADITVNKDATVNSIVIANDDAVVTGNALVTIGDGVSIGTLNGGNDFTTSSKLVFNGDASVTSIAGFDTITIQAAGDVSVSKTLAGTALTIEAAGFEDASKRVLTVKGGIDPDQLAITIKDGAGLTATWLSDGKTLVLNSAVVTDVYVNSTWTAEKVNETFIGDMLLIWDKNAFNTLSATAVANVGADSTLFVTGDFQTTDSFTFANAAVELSGNAFKFGAITGNNTALTVSGKEFTAASLSGISSLSVFADAVSISGGIAMAEEGTLTLDVTGHTQTASDVVVLTTGSGITGLAKDITVVGTDADHYHAYYDADDGNVHLLRIDNLYVDIGFGTAGELIEEGQTNPLTGELLVFGANAFYSLTEAVGKLAEGMGLYVNNRPYDLRTSGKVSNLYLTNSDIPVLVNGYTSGDQTYTGDIEINIIDSAVGRSGDSTLVMKTTVDSPWDHLNTVNGNVTVNVDGSTLGSATDNRTINGSDYLRVNNGNFTFNVSNSTVYSRLEVVGDSPLAGSEVVTVNFTNVSAPVDRDWWITDGNQNNASTIVVNLEKADLGTGSMRVGVQSDWNYGDRNSSNKVTFNVSDTTIGGALTADSIDLEELTGYTGDKVLNIKAGDNSISQILWFKTINVNAESTLTANEIRMSSQSAKLVVDAKDFTGASKVLVTTKEGIFGLTADDVSIVADPEAGYEVFTDYNATTKTMTSIVVKGALKDIYANEDYTLEDLTIGTSYNGEALFYNFNAFDTVDAALAALTVDSALYVTGTLSWESTDGQALTIANDLINTGSFKLSSHGFVDDTTTDVVVLTANSITGDGKFTTDNAAYTAVVVDNTVHLVLKKVDVFVSTEWEGLEAGEIVDIPGGTATIGTDAFATANDAAAKVTVNGTITVLSGTVSFSNSIVRTVYAASGTTIENANIGSSTGAGSLTLQSGATATNVQVRSGSTLTVEANSAVLGSLLISEGAVVSFGDNTALDLDISGLSVTSAAVLTGYSIMTGAPAISITIAGDQADGTYTIATDAASFNSVVTLKTAAAIISTTLTVGNMETIDGIEYTLAINDNSELTLTKKVYEAPITVTYVNPAWAEYDDGTVVPVTGGTAIVGKDAFADGDLATDAVIPSGIVKVVAGTVSFANGITKQTQVLSGAELTNTNVSSVLTIDAGATLSGTAAFADGANVTINGTVVFDLALAAESAQFTGFAVSGDATYTLVGEAAVGDYTLATGVTAFTSLTVGDQTLEAGASIVVGDEFEYSLTLDEGTLALNIATYVPPVVIPTITYVNSAWVTKEDYSKFQLSDGTEVTYKFDAFATGDEAIAAVSEDGEVKVLGGTVSFSDAIAKTVTISADATLFGKATFGTAITIDGTIAFDTALTADGAQINGLSKVSGATKYTLTAAAVAGTYTLASDAAGFNADVTFGTETLKVGDAAKAIEGFNYQLAISENNTLDLIVSAVGPTPEPKFETKSDINGSGISDVMFVWTGNNYAHGYWMDGTNNWHAVGGSHPVEWENLGCHDMTGDGKADSVLVGNVILESGSPGAYIGYYKDGEDLIDGSTWVTIGLLDNGPGNVWKNCVGNLTGSENAKCIIWYAPELYVVGAWLDSTDQWVGLTGNFGGDDWKLVGCGDFNGDGKDTIVMSGLNGTYLYSCDIDGNVASMGATNWGAWDVRAIGDFAGDGKDDMILFHQEYGLVAMVHDGNIDDYDIIGQLDAQDWFVVGAGDYNGDQQDDLLVRQYSTGMLGYYSTGDMAQWNVLGYGVDMQWTVIA